MKLNFHIIDEACFISLTRVKISFENDFKQVNLIVLYATSLKSTMVIYISFEIDVSIETMAAECNTRIYVCNPHCSSTS